MREVYSEFMTRLQLTGQAVVIILDRQSQAVEVRSMVKMKQKATKNTAPCGLEP